ncbi:MAG: MBL fold metallo-hydrolase [Verrucomicrobia bacterium]|nr:MBL fold metallo-hydrolase [Cytophagales bacterium]
MVQTFTFNTLQENTYLIYDETREAIIIDAGCYSRAEEKLLTDFVSDNQLTVKALLATHSHIDHVLGNAFVKKTYGVKLHIHPKDETTLRSVKLYAAMYGFPAFQESEADGFLNEGDIFRFGNTDLKILFVPGHAPGHIAFYNEAEGYVIGGDVLFKQSIGRTDLPGSDFEVLMHSIRTQFFTLPDQTVVYAGHFGETTIGEEKKYNPFLK